MTHYEMTLRYKKFDASGQSLTLVCIPQIVLETALIYMKSKVYLPKISV